MNALKCLALITLALLAVSNTAQADTQTQNQPKPRSLYVTVGLLRVLDNIASLHSSQHPSLSVKLVGTDQVHRLRPEHVHAAKHRPEVHAIEYNAKFGPFAKATDAETKNATFLITLIDEAGKPLGEASLHTPDWEAPEAEGSSWIHAYSPGRRDIHMAVGSLEVHLSASPDTVPVRPARLSFTTEAKHTATRWLDYVKQAVGLAAPVDKDAARVPPSSPPAPVGARSGAGSDARPRTQAYPYKLNVDEYLVPEDLVTASTDYILEAPYGDRRTHFQTDRNVVVVHYINTGGGLGYWSAQWSALTQNTSADKFVVQEDGNLVIYAGSLALWWTGTQTSPWPNPAYELFMENSGDLVLNPVGSSTIIWHTNT